MLATLWQCQTSLTSKTERQGAQACKASENLTWSRNKERTSVPGKARLLILKPNEEMARKLLYFAERFVA